MEVCVYLQGLGKNCALADPARPETYDLRLYRSEERRVGKECL